LPPQIRQATTKDSAALIELERLSPEMGRAAIRLNMRVNHFALAARYPDAKGYVALSEDGSAIVGMLFSSTAPAQINGRIMPVTYLFSLRVHPYYRHGGIASSLLDHACERASIETGARVFWGAIIEGNEASLRTLQHVGFVRLRDLTAKAVFGGLTFPRRFPDISIRSALPEDLPALAEVLNRQYTQHNFWRPRTPEQLHAELEMPLHSLEDTVVAVKPDGTVLGAASALAMHRLARLNLVGFRFLPRQANRLIAPLTELTPMNAVLVRNYACPLDRPEVGARLIQALHRQYLPRSPVAVVTVDPSDPSRRALQGLPGVTGRVHLVVKSDEPIDPSRPSCFT
jgi:L-amino acid N-acyltransferase YncA